MMTVHLLSAGDGYAYYIRETASADEQRERGQELGDYYAASGNPPGVWMGSGIEALGVSGTVSEAQMKALYGEGLHPDADRIIAERIAAGYTAKQAMRAAKLGRRYMQFVQKDTPFSRMLNEESERFARQQKREPNAKERAEIRGRVGAVQFRSEHGRSPESKEELGRFIKVQEGGKQRNAVAGFDLVFRAPKSISVLWGLGDESVRRAVEQAHVQAIGETLEWLEQKATMTRTGVNGIAQEDVSGGLIATRFRHYDSRTGDPLLHDHVVVSNKVMGLDGKWRSLDSKLLFAQNVPASEHYNLRVMEAVCESLGLRAEAREVTPGKRPVMEIAGVGTDLIEANSSRSKSIKERTVELVAEYREKHGYEPSSKTLTALMQQATLETRPDKGAARPLAELRTEWRDAAVEAFGADRVDRLLQNARAAAGKTRPSAEAVPHLDVNKAAREVLETVSDHRSVWGRRQVLAEARRWVMQATRGAAPSGDLAERITTRALAAEVIDITPVDLNPTFAPLARDDGTSIYRRRESELYTSTAILAAEDRIVSAARTQVIPAVSAEVYERVEAAYQQANPERRLDAGQRELARTFATSERLVAAGIGPAGAGKTTAMRVAADAVRESGGRVIGLGPSARAASELSNGLDAPAYILHEWLGARERLHQGQRVRAEFQLNAGDVIVVDEAGMAGSKRLAAVVAEAQAAGALVRLIGDPFQLSAVESGGALRLLANTVHVVELESLHRFRTVGEGAASLALRSGEPEDAWTWYLDNNRVVAGTREQMLHAIFADWQADIEQGHTALMMADDNASVTELNTLAQAYRMGKGQVDAGQAVDLIDGLQAHRGDMIVTRKNARTNVVRGGKDFVKNGDQWVVEAIKQNGDLVVRHTDHGGRTVLPTDYVDSFVELGYASTGHRGQGATVDTGSGLFTRATSRESAYVQTTRGRQQNRIYVVLDEGQTMRDVLDTIAQTQRASVSATEAIRAEQDRAWGIPQLAAEYTDVHARALSLRYQSMARSVLGQGAESIIAEDGWPAVERALRDAERAGFAPERILFNAYHERDFSDAEDNAAVLSWRIDNHVDDAQSVLRRLEEQGATRPLRDLTDEQLGRLAERTAERRAQALDTLHQADARVANQPRPIVVDGLPVPAWPGRQYGELSRLQLSQAIAEARRDTRLAALSVTRALRAGRIENVSALREGQGESAAALREDRTAFVAARRADAREAAARLHALKDEQRVRGAMTWRDRAREEWQREPGLGRAHTAGMDGESVAAEMRANLYGQDEAQQRLSRAELVDQRVRAEQRLRRLLPDAAEVVADHTGPLPEWLAPREVEHDQHTPVAWIKHLDVRRQIIDERLAQTGRALAADPPGWASALGPVPPRDTELRAAWERAAALADAWRTQRQVRPTQPGIGGQPGGRDAAAWQALQEQVAEVGRRARATASAAQRGEALAAAAREAEQPPTAELAPELVAVAVAEATADDERQEAADTTEPEREAAPVPDRTVDADDVQLDLADEVDTPAPEAARAVDADELHVPEPDQDPRELGSDDVQLDAAEEVQAPELEPERAADAGDVQLDPAEESQAPEPEKLRDEAAEERTADPEEVQETTTAAYDADASTEEDDARREDNQEPEQRRPYGDTPDAELGETLAYYVEAADAAQVHAAAQEARAAELLAALEPGGAVERTVDERAARVQAIQNLRETASQIPVLETTDLRLRQQAQALEDRLAETARFGRPAVRGDERVQLEERLMTLRAEQEQVASQITVARQRQADNERVAGNPVEHDEVLAAWQRAGGSREAVLERTLAARQRRADSAVTEAATARGDVGQFDAAAATVRQEMNRRDGQPYQQRIAEDARRIQAQQAVLQQQAQQAAQPGPDDQQNRSGPKR
ncbi:relaxase domain-containing protein (plasmid) [Streptomyces sp. NBC_01732]|uniref:MobF family relaxase n=1 Tax=Streptomyces sp. NBC_01732 TaxID=2975926 RepID=UPI00352C5FA4|nr:relaxase domain-containing protein [Streptomyces sp. NBC_01732]